MKAWQPARDHSLLSGVRAAGLVLLMAGSAAAEEATDPGFVFLPAPIASLDEVDRVAVADIDDDGRLDVIAVQGRFGNGRTVVLRNADDLGPTRSEPGPLLGEVSTITTADLDGDRLPELLVGYGNGKDVVQVFANVAGHYGRQPRLNIGLVPHRHHALQVGDINADGHADLLVGHSGGIKRFLGLGQHRFGPGRRVDRAGLRTRAMVLLDADADGRPDLLACHGDGPVLYRNLGWGAFAADGQPLYGGSAECQSLGIVDIDADGRPELLASSPFPMLFRSQACDERAPCSGLGDAVRLPHGRTIEVADFNLDGMPDLLSADTRMHIHAGTQSGDYAQPELIPAAFARSVIVADMDADGDPDLLVHTEMHSLLLLANQVR